MVRNLTAAPQLTEKPQDVQKTIDDTLVWECKANAKPKPSYRWLKNGEPLDHMEVNLNLHLHAQQRGNQAIPGKSAAVWSVIFRLALDFPRNKLCVPLLTLGHMCWGLNLAFRERACAVPWEGGGGLCVLSRRQSDGDDSNSRKLHHNFVLKFLLVWESPLHPKIRFTLRHRALFFLSGCALCLRTR